MICFNRTPETVLIRLLMMKYNLFKNSWLWGRIMSIIVLLFLFQFFKERKYLFGDLRTCASFKEIENILWMYEGFLVFNSQHGLRKILRLRWSGLLLILFAKWGNKYRLYRNGFHRRVWTPQSSFVFYKSHRKWAALKLSQYPFPIVVEFLNQNPSTVLARLLIVEMYSLLEITWRRGQCGKRRYCCYKSADIIIFCCKVVDDVMQIATTGVWLPGVENLVLFLFCWENFFCYFSQSFWA